MIARAIVAIVVEVHILLLQCFLAVVLAQQPTYRTLLAIIAFAFLALLLALALAVLIRIRVLAVTLLAPQQPPRRSPAPRYRRLLLQLVRGAIVIRLLRIVIVSGSGSGQRLAVVKIRAAGRVLAMAAALVPRHS